MRKESVDLLATIAPPEGSISSQATDDVYALVAPVHDALDKVRAHFGDVETKRRRADASEDDETVFHNFERIKQTSAAALRICTEISERLDKLTDTCFQLDRYGDEVRRVQKLRDSIAAGEEPTTPEGRMMKRIADTAHVPDRGSV